MEIPTDNDRTILRLSGSDTRKFLQGLVTNDVNKLAQGIVYAALLTPQGKYLADFFLIADGDDVLMDVHKDLAQGLAQRLNMYRLRSDVQITATNIVMTRGLGDARPGAFADPRHDALGWRAYDGRAGESADWDALRVAHIIPQSGVELLPDNSYILEMDFERLNGVDFRKGCYVGQEVTARMKHKTELRKGLAKVAISAPVPIGTPIISGGKEVGHVYTSADGKALAYLRFDRARGEMSAGPASVTLI